MIEIEIPEPFSDMYTDRKRVVLTETNTVVSPEIQLVDEHGNIFALTDGAKYPHPSVYEKRMSYSVARDNLPQDRVYTKVRIRSDKPLRSSGIFWHCHTGK